MNGFLVFMNLPPLSWLLIDESLCAEKPSDLRTALQHDGNPLSRQPTAGGNVSNLRHHLRP
jgi:hypothetical protein